MVDEDLAGSSEDIRVLPKVASSAVPAGGSDVGMTATLIPHALWEGYHARGPSNHWNRDVGISLVPIVLERGYNGLWFVLTAREIILQEWA